MNLLQILKTAGKRGWRVTDQSASIHSSRSLSITCRGKSISREELYTYSNGRFLVNEAHAFSRRHVRFDVDQLCNVAAAVGLASPIQSIEKMEGGFSKALLMRREDGSEMIAKIPFPIAGPSKYTTASEVAVLEYLRTHTKVPVPKVFAWNSNASNPVGAEYIIMEKASGVQLFRKWGDMNDVQRFELVQRLTQLEGEIGSIRFPANGSLYFRGSLAESETKITLSRDVDPSEEYCLGPSCERQWDTQTEVADRSSATPLNRGPWPSISSFGIALVDREVARIKHQNPSTISLSDRPRGSTEEQLAVLAMVRELMSMLDTGTLIDYFSRPVLWHTDLHMGNIFVSDEDPTTIVSIIDWQSISISPLFLQARFPEFLEVGDDFILKSPVPQLPPGYATMDADDKQIAEYKVRQATMVKAYEVASAVHNPPGHKALFMPKFLQDLFTQCLDISKEGIIPLRASLLQIADAWHDLAFKAKCPFSFHDEELQNHNQQFQQHRDFHAIQDVARKLLDTDTEGWISPHIDFACKSRQNKELRDEVARRSSEYNKSPEEVCRIWPF